MLSQHTLQVSSYLYHPVVVEKQNLQTWKSGEPFYSDNGIVRKIYAVELILQHHNKSAAATALEDTVACAGLYTPLLLPDFRLHQFCCLAITRVEMRPFHNSLTA